MFVVVLLTRAGRELLNVSSIRDELVKINELLLAAGAAAAHAAADGDDKLN